MSKQVQAQGLTGLIKKYLARDNFAQYVTGLVVITAIIALFWQFNNDDPDRFWIAIFVIIVIVFLLLDVIFGLVNIYKDRYSVRTKNFYSILETEEQRRSDPTLTQQLRADMADIKAEIKGIKPRLPSQEILDGLGDAVHRAGIAIELQKDEAKLLSYKDELQKDVDDLQKEISDDEKKLLKIEKLPHEL